jgi:DNA-binding MarR family transcriptional regulator
VPLPIRDLPADRELAALTDGGDASPVTLVLTLLLVARELYSSADRFFAGHGISDAKWSVLMLLASAPARRLQPSEIAARLAVTRATVTGVLRGLERDGLVARHAHPRDGRSAHLTLTRRGTALLARMKPELARRHAETVAALTPAQSRTLVRLLRALRVPENGS